MSTLEKLGIIPINYAVLRSLFSEYKFPKNKIAALENEGKIIRLKKGMYVVSPDVSGLLLSTELIANHIYGPSYVSMESALRYYGLIPEQVFTVRSITTKRSRSFENSIARFQYMSVNEEYYPVGIRIITVDNECSFLIASPAKALCDLIITTPHLNIISKKAAEIYLEEDLRFDMSASSIIEPDVIGQCAATGKKKESLSILQKLFSR